MPLEAELVGWVAPTGISPAVGPEVPEKCAISKAQQRPVLHLHCLCKYLCFLVQQAKAPKQPGAGGAEEEE